MKKYTPVLFCFLITFYQVCSLHLKMHLAISNYVAQMESSYSAIGTLLDDLSSKTQSIISAYDSDEDLDSKLALIDSTFQEEKSIVADLEKNLVKPINQSQWACSDFSDEQISSLNSEIGGLQSELGKLAKTIDNLTDTSHNESPSQTIISLNQQLQRTSKILYASGQNSIDVQNPQILYKTNLMAFNWIINDKSIDEISKEYSSNEKIIKICPEDQPFHYEDQCQECTEQPNIYFDLDKSQCVQCLNFDSVSHKCLDTYGSNIQTASERLIIPADKVLESYSSDVMCPEDNPFYDGSSCLNCEDPDNLFDVQQRKCTSCRQENELYNKTLHRCQQKLKYFTNLASDFNKQIILPPDMTFQSLEEEKEKLKEKYRVVECTSDVPFLSNGECISCDEALLFDYSSQTCKNCQQNYYYDKNTYHCVPVPFYTNLDSSLNWVIPTKSEQQIRQQIDGTSQKQYAKMCESSVPFFNGQSCIACDNQQFDLENQQCISCEENQYFSQTTHKCLVTEQNHQTNPNKVLKVPNLIFGQKSYNYWMERYFSNLLQNSALKDCPSQRPYWSVESCISCPSGRPYFNMESQKCQNCDDGYSYDESKHECVSEDGSIQE